MVVSSQHLASQIGADILREGGNAIDAAVAVGYAEAVTNPCCGNIGGGGFMVIHLAKDNRDIFINFREKAPAAATGHVSRRSGQRRSTARASYGYLCRRRAGQRARARHGAEANMARCRVTRSWRRRSSWHATASC